MPLQSLYTNTFSEHTDLKMITDKYPYFSVAHFYLLQQTAAGNDGYEKIAAKTALHFANPYLLNQQLNTEDTSIAGNNNAGKETINDIVVEEQPFVADEPTQEPVAANNQVETKNVVTEQVTEEPKEPLLFEPLHTTDYFASQGIKLSEVVPAGDKMGRQLKSFTEWLKTMKKVHPDGLKEKTEGIIDPSVQHLAEKSNKEEEVLTESMAEVYLQQGKTNKAKEIYEKLSLLNPSKNAYFAAKLNEIQ